MAVQRSIRKILVQPRLREVIKKANISQKELSGRTGISPSVLSRFDSQTSHKDEHVFLIVKALGITVEELFKVEKGDI